MNRKHLIDFKHWVSVTPSAKSVAQFASEARDRSLRIVIPTQVFGQGKWVASVPVTAGGHYRFSATAKVENATLHDVYVLYTIADQDGKWLIREHIEQYDVIEGGFSFCGDLTIPEEGVSCTFELWLKGRNCSVKWGNISFCESEAEKPRNVRIALAYIAPGHPSKPSLEANRDMILTAVDNAGSAHPDIIVLSETMYDRGTGLPLQTVAETDTGSMCCLMSHKAKKYHSYLIYNFHEQDGAEYYITSILFDREGQTVGKYRKTHLAVTEFDHGLTPGDEIPVFKTDFGTIGMLICYDHFFPRVSEEIVRKGAELVLISSAGDAGERLSARAMDTGTYFAVCGWNCENDFGWGAARVVDPIGKVIAQTKEHLVPCMCDIDLNRRVRGYWMSVGPAYSQYKGDYFYEQNPRLFDQ